MADQQRRPRADTQAETRRNLLDAAQRLFIRNGFHRTSVGEIAKEAGYTTGAIYSNFPRKEDLAVAVTDRAIEHSWAALLDALASRQEFADRLIGVIEWRRQLLVENEVLVVLRLELWLYSVQDLALRAQLVAGQRKLQASLALLLEQQATDVGSRLTVSPDLLAGAVIASADGTAIAHGLDPSKESAEAFAWTLATLVVGSMEPRPIRSEDWAPFLEKLLAAAHG